MRYTTKMDAYTLASIVLTIAMLLGYINHRYIRMQSTIAIMVGSITLSIFLLLLQHFQLSNFATLTSKLLTNNFRDLLLKGMLSFLLFAGALTIDTTSLKRHKWEIGLLASISTLFSAALIGMGAYWLLPYFGIHLSLLYCLLFGALISPTDPIAVLATIRHIGAPKRIETCIAGESLFNDGVGIVLFTTLYALAFQHDVISFSEISLLFLKQAVGGLAYGILLGYVTKILLKGVKESRVIIMLTLAAVSGGYSFALWLNISGPLAMVVYGIYLGSLFRQPNKVAFLADLDTFWGIIDELLNAILFLLIGFELLSIHVNAIEFAAALTMIPLVLFFRLITVAIPLRFLQFKRDYAPYTISILTWGGLRGGLAVALVLSLPPSHLRQFILAMTYAVVAFSVIVQGLTIKSLASLTKQQ